MFAPDESTVRLTLDLVRRAPSVGDLQPWHWCWDGRTLLLLADRGRGRAGELTRREIVVSCGAALYHAVTAFGASGWETVTEDAQGRSLLDDDHRPGPTLAAGGTLEPLVRLSFRPRQPSDHIQRRLRSLLTLRRDQPVSGEAPLPVSAIRTLARRARDCGVRVAVRPSGEARAAIPTQRAPLPVETTGTEQTRTTASGLPGDTRMLLLTVGDTDPDLLQVGRAAAAVLAEAATLGLATVGLGESLRAAESERPRIPATLGRVQLSLRVGWSTGPVSVPPPRRSVDEILTVTA